MPDTAELVRRDGVELIRTGSWQISTGRWDASREDLAAAVAAMSCPAVRKPILKIGHVDQRFAAGDGEPAIGWVDNLRLADGGHTLLGDYEGMPAWLGGILASAYPDRSVEGAYNHKCQLGHTHPFALTAVALLGVTPPGVGTLRSLNDVKALYGLAASADPSPGEVRIAAAIPGAPAAAVEQQHTGAMIALIPTAEDAARLAVEGGEPADELHVTLAYLGEAADLDSSTRQDIIDTVSSAVNGMPIVEADAFALSAFNPARADRDTCIVLGLSGDDLDMAHTLIEDALADLDVPEQHAPWVAHMTLIYTEDIARLTELTDRIGPVTFDRLRIALAGQHIDIPLTDPTEDDVPELTVPNMLMPVSAASDQQLRNYWLHGEGAAKVRWNTPGDFTRCVRYLRKYVRDPKGLCAEYHKQATGVWPGDRRNVHASEKPMPNPQPDVADRIRAAWNASAPHEQWIVEVAEDHVIVTDETNRSFSRVPVKVGDSIEFGQPVPVRPGYVTEPVAASVVYASRTESRPDVAATQPEAEPVEPEPDQQEPLPLDDPQPPAEPEADPELPAAEPEPTNPETEEDPVSDLSEFRSRLGLDETADETAVLAALDALKEKADTSTSQVAAARDEMKAAIEHLSAELASIKASAAADTKKALFDNAIQLGKLKPADRDGWEARYDRAPDVITEILASIAPNTAVPVAASGYTGQSETQTDEDAEFEAIMARLDGPTATAKGGN